MVFRNIYEFTIKGFPISICVGIQGPAIDPIFFLKKSDSALLASTDKFAMIASNWVASHVESVSLLTKPGNKISAKYESIFAIEFQGRYRGTVGRSPTYSAVNVRKLSKFESVMLLFGSNHNQPISPSCNPHIHQIFKAGVLVNSIDCKHDY